MEFWIVTHPEDLIYNCPCPCFGGEVWFFIISLRNEPPHFLCIQKTSVMEKVQLVYAEIMDGVTMSMLEDKQVVIISDGALFIVTTEENSKKYEGEFYPVGAEAIEAYGIII